MKMYFIIMALVLLCSTVFAQNFMLDFDGSNDYVTCGKTLVGGKTDFTISVWVKPPPSYSNYGTGIVCEWINGGMNPGGNNFSTGFNAGASSSSPYIPGFSIEQSTTTHSVISDTEISAGDWHHIAFVKEADEIRVIVNDNITTASCGAGAINNISTTHFRMGVFGGSGFNYHYSNITLDEVRVWDTALDQTTIQEWKNKSLDASHSNWSDLLGYWKLDEGSGQITGDSSGNGNDGQLGNSANPDNQDPSWGLSDSPLPIVLSSFTAIQTQADFAQINWTTQSETNLYGYNVYRNVESEINSSYKLNSAILEAENSSNGSDYSFTDEYMEFEQVYFYWLESVDLGGNTEFFGPISITLEDNNQIPELPNETLLQSAYPNPFNPKTTINFSVKENEMAQLIIYNVKGQIVKNYPLFENGNYSIEWLGKDNFGKNVSSGVFFYRLKSASTTQIKKMLLLK